MKYDTRKWIDGWDRDVLRACLNPEAQRSPSGRAKPTRACGHCFLCASYIQQDAGLTSLRAKSQFFSGLKPQRPLIERVLIEWRRASAGGGQANKFKKI